jgi:hypothetical protein
MKYFSPLYFISLEKKKVYKMPPKKANIQPRFMSEKSKMDWSKAVRIWNQGKQGYCIPRKGTKEYMEVQRIMRTGPRQKGF